MGTWSHKSFGNDGALDWVDALPDHVVETFKETFRRANETRDAEHCCCAIAAAELIAKARGHAGTGMPEEAHVWLAEHDFSPSVTLTNFAIRTLRTILSDSELADLWVDVGDKHWRSNVERLIERLGRPAKVPSAKPAKKPGTRRSSSPQRLTVDCRSDDCWGAGSFENLPAHDYSYDMATESHRIEDVAASLTGSRGDCQRLVAVGELLNAIRGNLPRIACSPLLLDWVTSRRRVVKDSLVHDVADRIETIVRTSSLRRFWQQHGSAALDAWVTNTQSCISQLRKPAKKATKPPSISKRQMRVAVKSMGGFCSEVRRNSDELSVVLSRVDPKQAVELTRYRAVGMLELDPHSGGDELNETGVRLLLRGWWNRIQYLTFYQTPAARNPYVPMKLLQSLHRELSQLPSLKVFDSRGFVVTDKTVESIAANKKLEELAISDGIGPTNRALSVLAAKCAKLRVVRIFDSKITWQKACEFDVAHPKIGVNMSCMYE